VTETTQRQTFDITLLRHGESIGNANRYWQGQSDFPLTEKGRQQAAVLAQRWQAEGRHFDLVISSPLKRARATAEEICKLLDLPVEYDEIWQERDNGLYAGLPREQALERHPEPAFLPPFMPIGKTGESQWELYLRAGKAISNLLRRDPGSYLIVSHGGLLNMVLYAALSIPVQANFSGPRFTFENSAFAQLSYRPDRHQWRLLALNDHAHLALLTEESEQGS
jgi:broad specificity phosphatase PhoE